MVTLTMDMFHLGLKFEQYIVLSFETRAATNDYFDNRLVGPIFFFRLID